jgi:hypothetical protein
MHKLRRIRQTETSKTCKGRKVDKSDTNSVKFSAYCLARRMQTLGMPSLLLWAGPAQPIDAVAAGEVSCA